MTNTVALYFSIEKDKELSKQIEDSLSRWDIHKETKNFIPEFLVFSLQDKGTLQIEELSDYGLEVKFRQDVQRNHYKIEANVY